MTKEEEYFWRKICRILEDAPEEIKNDSLKVEIGTYRNFLQIRCTERLKDYLEREEVLSRVRSHFLSYANSRKCKYIQYLIHNDT